MKQVDRLCWWRDSHKPLDFDNNEFTGDFIITAENFHDLITVFSFRYNAGLTSINADFGAIPQVETLYITNMKDSIVKKELSERRPGLRIVRLKNKLVFYFRT